jgi:hypothetical protein
MRTNFDTSVFGFFNGIEKTLNIMASVDESQGRIAGGLQTIFNPDQVVPGIFLE